jgi:signal transduction histidine kinase
MSSDRVQEIAQERGRTNESLRTEREKADQAVAAKQENVAQHADAVVGRARDNADAVLSVARENADAVLDAARDRADEMADPGVAPSVERRVVEERVLADEIIRGERDIADETLRQEREEYARTLRRFLPLERESTDRYLLTERIRSDDAVANRDDFLAIVTHDLRDLIGGIVMSATVLAKRAAQNEDGKNTLAETKRIERYAARMNRLIGDLVDVASIDAGKLAITPAPQDLTIVIAEAEDTFRATASAKGILLGTQIDAAPLLAALDHDRILQVLANLISNSLKFTPQGGKITICGESEAAGLRLSVVDTGSGIPDDALERIFDRFSQVGRNDRRGLGLGLYISRNIVEAHGGRIWAESRPGAGSRICFTLPGRLPVRN